MRYLLIIAILMLGAGAAQAFDCKLARTASEKAICNDPAALAADAALGASFIALKDRLPAAARAGLTASQVAWIKQRDSNCAEIKPLAQCLAQSTEARTRFLEARPSAGPGAPIPLTPSFRFVKGGKGVSAVSVETLKFENASMPGARAFNVAVDALLSDIQQPEADDPLNDRYSFDLSLDLVYASPRLVSAHAVGYSFTGGAHGLPIFANINVDMTRSVVLNHGDLLDKPAAEKIDAFCIKSVLQEKRERLTDEAETDEGRQQTVDGVKEANANLDNWSFNEKQATVIYAPYVVASYAAGMFACDIPYAMLRPLAKPGFPLP